MIKRLIIKLLWIIGRHSRIHLINKSLLELNYYNLKKSQKYKDPKNLINYGFKVYSQSDEDGIINEIFKRIGIKKNFFIEFGLQDGKECNTAFLLKSGWSGSWVDMSTNVKQLNVDFKKFINKNLKFYKYKILKSNVNEIIQKCSNENKEIDLLSIDIGINTYHVLNEIILNPRVIVTEYNAKLRDEVEWTADYSEKKVWDGDDNFGASLKSFEIMMNEKGYFLVACNITGVNAFFVRKDLINSDFIDNYSSNYHYEPLRGWLIKNFENELKVKI
jgi:hypothetical protein